MLQEIYWRVGKSWNKWTFPFHCCDELCKWQITQGYPSSSPTFIDWCLALFNFLNYLNDKMKFFIWKFCCVDNNYLKHCGCSLCAYVREWLLSIAFSCTRRLQFNATNELWFFGKVSMKLCSWFLGLIFFIYRSPP